VDDDDELEARLGRQARLMTLVVVLVIAALALGVMVPAGLFVWRAYSG
jgi:hypothetical protein